jgi:uncharacterized protein (TIGR02246 family)
MICEQNTERGNEMNIEKIAKETFAKWAEALKTRDSKEVSGLYTEDCTFLPTFSQELMVGREKANGYFVHFLEKHPEAEIVAEVIKQMGENFILHTGHYDFDVEVNGKKGKARARFDFIYEKQQDGKYEVFHHHSSAMPEA